MEGGVNRERCLVVDHGSGFIKAGFVGDDAPSLVFPTAVKAPRNDAGARQYTNAQFGYSAIENEASKDLQYPIVNGSIEKWDDMEAVWHYIFDDEIGILPPPDRYPILFSEPPINNEADRTRLMEIMFETFEVSSVCLQSQAVLSLCASGRTTGVVLESGHDCTYTVPIHEGVTVPDAINSFDFAGRFISQFLRKSLIERGFASAILPNSKLFSDIKETVGYVSMDYDSELKNEQGKNGESYKLPDGSAIDLGKEVFQCAEVMFKPSLIGKGGAGVHDILLNSINKCNADLRSQLFGNIILGGGNTMFKGFEQRVSKEILALAPEDMIVQVVAPPERKHAAWVGGSIMAENANNSNWWLRWAYQYPPVLLEMPDAPYEQGWWYGRTDWEEGAPRTPFPVWDREWREQPRV